MSDFFNLVAGAISASGIEDFSSNANKPNNFIPYQKKCATLKRRIEQRRAAFYKNSGFEKNLTGFSAIQAHFKRNHSF